MPFAENAMELIANGEGNYSFSDDWSFEREGDYYHIKVTAAMESSGEEILLGITCHYVEEENTIYMEYVTVNGEVFSDLTNKFERPERKQTSGD